ncbi:MAG TPA: DUF2520 domain-containing protein [Terriglobales bacterium]|nr:DUF2520 domain-containing protein [Terriglobales bacterium]
MAKKPSIAIVGPGRLGTALVRHLSQAGYKIAALIGREVNVTKPRTQSTAPRLRTRVPTIESALLNANVIWFCVPDREISRAASALAAKVDWSGKTAFHSSGALSSHELDVLRRRGAAVASVHPLMTFVRGAVPSLEGVPFALEGDKNALRIAQKIVRDLGGEPFKIRAEDKVAYHTWGAFASPLLVALLVSAEQVARVAGVSASDARRKMLPILRQTIENYGRLGPAGAFSGPWVRGDAEVVRQHLRILRRIPAARDVYLSLGKASLNRLPVQQKKRLQKTLKQYF